jgi:excisionase family DNA binding protein
MGAYGGVWSLVTVRCARSDTGGRSTQTPTRDGTVLLTPADAAHMAAVSRDTIYREIERGELRAVHVGRQLRIRQDDFDRYLEREPP